MVQFVKKTIGELFHFESSNAIYHAINVTVLGKRETNSFPYVVRSSVHNGIKGYIVEPKNGLNSGNTISLAQDTGEFFYQEKSYFTGNKVKVLMPIGFELTKRCALYLMTVMQKAFYAFTWGSSFNTDVMKRVEVVVPVTDSGQLDVQYMEQYIKRIEAQYIKRIEAQYVKRIEAYLSVLGYDSIDDCKLSSQDLKVLSGPDEWDEFRIGDLFDEIQIGRKYVRNELSPHGQTPVYSSVEENGGILGYINNQAEFELDVSHPYIVFGDHTRTMQIPDNDFSVADNVKVLRGKHAYSVKQLLYIMTCFKKVIPNLGYSRHWTTAKELSFYLPVCGDGSIAYDYMDCYITAVEKKKVLLLKQHLDKRLDLYQRAIKK